MSPSQGGDSAQRTPDPVLPPPPNPSGFRGLNPPPETLNDDQSTASPRFDTVVTTYSELEQAIKNANAQPGIDHLIRVRPNVYTFNPPGTQSYGFQINDNVSLTIQGEALVGSPPIAQPAVVTSVVFQKATTDSRTFSLFRVGKLATLVLRNVQLQNGGGTAAAFDGGAIRVQGDTSNGGTVKLFDVTVFNNSVTQHGGGIFLNRSAKLNLTNVLFANNAATFGGAIYVSQGAEVKVKDGAFGAFCAGFEFNFAYDGGAVYGSSAASIVLDRSGFRYNGLQPPGLGYIDGTHYPANQYGSASVLYARAASPFDQNGSLPDNFTPNFAPPPPLLIVPGAGFSPFDCDSKIPLEYFSVDIISTPNRQWTTAEIGDIEKAVRMVSAALKQKTSVGGSLPEVFRRVMFQGSQIERLVMIRDQTSASSCCGQFPDIVINYQSQNRTYEEISQGVCKAWQAATIGGVYRPYGIACNGSLVNPFGGLAIDQTIVHELGHIMDYRSNSIVTTTIAASSYLLGSCVSIEFPKQPPQIGYDNYIVMGFVGGVFKRGSRGWGSEAGISIYQQSTENIPLEATADMFLNWVYRANSQFGFPRVDGVSTTNNPPTFGCKPVAEQLPQNQLDQDWSGFLNQNWNLSPAPFDWGYPGEVRHRWMDNTMQSVMQTKGW